MRKLVLIALPAIAIGMFLVVRARQEPAPTGLLYSSKTKAEPAVDDSVSILNFGDMMFDRNVRKRMQNGLDPFASLRGTFDDLLPGVDFVVANLEGPIVEMDRKKCQIKAYNFQFASTTPALLRGAGIDLVNLANNHAFDCYQHGVASTTEYLDAAGLDYFGGESLETSYLVKSVGDKSVAFVGIDQTIRPTKVKDFYPLMKELKSANDYVIVNIHWGNEYEVKESKVQNDIAHNLIDNGVDVVFGHHPHVIQPVEVYKGKAIFYSLGNLIFDQIDPGTNQGIGAGVVLEASSTSAYVFPYTIDKSEPKMLSPEEALTFCKEYLKDIASSTGCTFLIEQRSLVE